jgi:hypothetical protein
MAFLKSNAIFFLRELQDNERKVAEGYCWAITQEVG